MYIHLNARLPLFVSISLQGIAFALYVFVGALSGLPRLLDRLGGVRRGVGYRRLLGSLRGDEERPVVPAGTASIDSSNWGIWLRGVHFLLSGFS